MNYPDLSFWHLFSTSIGITDCPVETRSDCGWSMKKLQFKASAAFNPLASRTQNLGNGQAFGAKRPVVKGARIKTYRFHLMRDREIFRPSKA